MTIQRPRVTTTRTALLFLFLWATASADETAPEACPLCYGGADPTVEDLDAVIYTQLSSGEEVTCNTLSDGMASVESSSLECAGLQEISFIHCGCPDRSPDITCFLCLDGSIPPNLDAQVFSFDEPGVCRDVIVEAAQVDGDSDTCRQLQDVGLSNCGCTTPEELQTGCTLCEGGNDLLPEPEREVIPFVTCEGISKVIERFDGTECTAYQNVIGATCGCPEQTGEGVCLICGGDSFVDLPGNPVDLTAFDGSIVPCAFYEVVANDASFGLTCEEFQTGVTELCCNAVSPVPTPLAPATSSPAPIIAAPPCPICANGQPICNPDGAVVIEGEGNTTCADLNSAGLFGFIPEDFCPVIQETYGEFCGCNEECNVFQCPVCADGSDVCNPDQGFLFPGEMEEFTCEEYDVAGRELGEVSEADCPFYQLVLEGPCGCGMCDSGSNSTSAPAAPEPDTSAPVIVPPSNRTSAPDSTSAPAVPEPVTPAPAAPKPVTPAPVVEPPSMGTSAAAPISRSGNSLFGHATVVVMVIANYCVVSL